MQDRNQGGEKFYIKSAMGNYNFQKKSMKIIFFFLVIILGFITPSYAQVKTLKEPVQTTNRTGDGTAPISSETKDSSTLLSDIAAAYDRTEQNIEQVFNKLIKDDRSTIDHLNDQIKELNAMIKKSMEQIKKLDSLLKKISDLEQIMQQLEQEKQNGMQNLKEQKRKAIQQANELIKQKRSRDLQVFSQTIKIQMVKAGQDSLLSISLRYQVHQ